MTYNIYILKTVSAVTQISNHKTWTNIEEAYPPPGIYVVICYRFDLDGWESNVIPEWELDSVCCDEMYWTAIPYMPKRQKVIAKRKR